MSVSRVRQSKSIPLIYGGLAGVLLFVIAAMALVLVPPSPPQVAEFAPQAQENIDEAPDQQSSQFGLGSGGVCAAGQICEGPDGGKITPSRTVIEKARVRRCVGNPPRQTEDPQSPPCVNFFEGNNGGATAKGVTRDEIRLAHANWDTATPNMAVYFNRRYEFYGRKLVPVPYNDSGACDAPGASRRGQEMASLGVFAAVTSTSCGQPSFAKEMALQKIVTVHRGETLFRQTDLLEGAPYLWSYLLPVDETYSNFVEFACKGLAGRNAAHAGPELSLRARAFAVFVARGETHPAPIVTNGLTRCGAKPVVVEEINGTLLATESDPSVRLAVGKANTSGATSVICLCWNFVHLWAVMVEADRQAYHPEWVLPGLSGLEATRRSGSFIAGSPEQRGRMFGISGRNKPLREEDRPSQWAMKELAGYESWYANTGVDGLDNVYQALLVLASGIQMSGPRLTPSSFERALETTQFPNPGAGKSPYWQASVGFRRGDHSMIDDLNMMWLDNTRSDSEVDESVESVSFCYLYRGARYAIERWPSGPLPFFDRTQPCR